MQDNQHNNASEQKSDHEIADYYEGMKKLEMQGYQTAIRNARNALFATGALVFVGELISASTSGVQITPILIGIALLEAAVFIALGFWTKTKPYAAIITGLILFILMWVAAIVINGGRGVYSGIVIKIIVIVYLVKALKDAKAWEDAKKSV